ncbi:zinc-dependent alcohol dehydrogenase family protein [Enterococcus malodoratus]|uniref:Chlorophyll synthesis pathway protein BchC n=1 Tax=Enterococcus malodoratus ATCC 43197 TaxID=1158601 RepID=R2R733_9ENTE|nr:zinc-dependent alcohol dehydrogenase family protein [Enterococcus malodoratus]EOH79400.1 chlorophyll synthesis pathway protein BchC [Enterococcus malodoratus ATCC 43197]EOT64841.1 chlorophyll synthesis pathway protein BchC [Enterococcus malodoratus ATCC 43197]OJG62793.1 chlorophyll synthesis pathway protein BchC [Enterococcus malodoratus]SPX03666.1 chlorophyll synthesis pathway protein BchC [Enterococcus malodoratus]STC72252.1 chlorophyll synthesis pathway protein BchC [Enterococcus malodor
MKAGYYVGDYTYEVRDIPENEPVEDQVKIRVAWCGLCGTDVHKFQGKNGASVVVPPIILGHECSGIVTAVGPECKYFKPGDRVACDPSYGCGKCSWCQQGFPNFCIERHGVAKGFSEYVYPPEQNVYPIADSLDLETAAFTEPLSCAIHGLDLIQIQSGKTVVMYGMGAIGSLMLQLIKYSGAGEIIVVEREAEKRELALKLGASLAVTDQEIEALSKELNIDYVVECIGLKQTMEQAIKIAGKNGKVLLFGLGDPEEPVSFNQFEAYTKELSIYTSFLNPHTSERAVKLLESGLLDTKSIISAELSLEEIGSELRALEYSRKGKVMVYLSKEH